MNGRVASNLVVDILQGVSGAAAVTTAEARLYRWLKAYVESDGELAQQLRVGHIAEQMCLAYMGAPKTSRWCVLVCHADREGYLPVDDLSAGQRTFLARRPNSIDADADREGLPAQIVVTMGSHEERLSGVMAGVSVSPTDGVSDLIVELDEPVSVALASVAGRGDCQVTVHEGFECSTHDRGSASLTAEGWGMDNAAGVAAGTAAVVASARSNSPVNMAVIYTRGEESGFRGALAVLERGIEALGPEPLIVVVDCSEVSESRVVPYSEWRQLRGLVPGGHGRCKGDPLLLPTGGYCDPRTAYARVEDRLSIFDASVALLLHQSGLNCRGRSTVNDAGDPRTSGTYLLGQCAQMCGGLCEGSVISHASDIGNVLGGRHRSMVAAGLRTGVIGIPLENYRHRVSGHRRLVTRAMPERVYLEAVHGASELACDTAYLYCDNYVLGRAYYAGHRGGQALRDSGLPQDREAVVALWAQRIRGEAPAAEGPTTEWVAEHLSPIYLGSGIPDPM